MKCETTEAWRLAVRRAQARASLAAAHPIDALKPVLVKYLTYGGSTSGVEQGFAKILRGISPQQLSANPELEGDIIKVVVDRVPGDNGEEREVVTCARKRWGHPFGDARSSPALPRLDKGITKKLQESTETGWLRKRRAGVSIAASSTDPQKLQNDIQDPGVVGHRGGSRMKEWRFQEEKLEKKLVRGYDEGTLLPEETT